VNKLICFDAKKAAGETVHSAVQKIYVTPCDVEAALGGALIAANTLGGTGANIGGGAVAKALVFLSGLVPGLSDPVSTAGSIGNIVPVGTNAMAALDFLKGKTPQQFHTILSQVKNGAAGQIAAGQGGWVNFIPHGIVSPAAKVQLGVGVSS
jgi:hypothetical protein